MGISGDHGRAHCAEQLDASECHLEVVLAGMGVCDPAIPSDPSQHRSCSSTDKSRRVAHDLGPAVRTYYNPDDVRGELSFGLAERVPPVRLVIGL